MSAIKIHLEQAEYDVVARLADELNLKPEAIAYAALNRLMLERRNREVRAEIAETWEWRRDNLPLWSDSACSVHAYECMPDDEPTPSDHH